MRYHTFAGFPLWDWYTIDIEVEGADKGDCHKVVYFNSGLHVTKRNRVSHSYSMDWSDSDILRDRDLVNWVVSRYGNVNS